MSWSIQDLQQMFDRLIEAAEADRAAMLNELCHGDFELRFELERLMGAHQRSLDSPILLGPLDARYTAAALQLDADNPPSPERIGPYRVIRLIGEGGFGLVYLAERQEPFRQVVAVKVLKPGMDSRAILTRFSHEREALGMLSHQNIARIFDAGQTESGYPYFVMDYIDGEPITRFCRKYGVSLSETIALLIDVGLALQHAHARGVIHRDLKPANILVQRHGDRPHPTVIDFGIAKLLDSTRANSRATDAMAMVGTLEYMSPEQAILGPPHVDIRADVYGLGAVLYELLTGRPPLVASGACTESRPALVEFVRETRPPMPLLSERPPHWPASEQDKYRELAWVALKALRHDRERRYQSAAELVSDLRACLSGGPVSAGPDSRMYLARKLVRRHRAAVLAGIGVLIGLSLLAGISLLAARRERRLRLIAEEAQAHAETRQLQLASAQGELSRQSMIANLAAGAALLESDDAIAARNSLVAIPEPSRGCEWGLLWSITDESTERSRPFRTTIESMSLSRNGRWLAVAANLGGLKILDPNSLETLTTLAGHAGQRSIACVFHPTDDVLITGDFEGRLRLYSAPRFEILREVRVDSIDDLRCSPDGRTLAYRQPRTRDVVVLDYPTLEERCRLERSASDVAFLGDRSLLAVAGGYSLEVTDLAGQSCLRVDIPVDFADIAVSPDGQLIAAACSDQTIVFRSVNLEAVRTITHESAVGSCLFSDDGRSLMTMGIEQVFRRWDLATGRMLDQRRAPVNGLRAGPLFDSGRQFFSGAHDGSVVRWQVHDPRTLVLPRARISHAAIDPTGKRLVLCSWKSGSLHLVDVDTMRLVNTIATGWRGVDRVGFTREPDTVLICGHLGAATIDLRTGHQTPIPVPGKNEPGANFVPLPDGRSIFGYPGQTPCIIEPLTRTIVEHPEWTGLGLPIGASRSGRWAAFLNDTDDVAIVDLGTRKLAFAMPGQPDRTHTAVFSADDSLVVLANWSDRIAIHELATGQRVTGLQVSGATASCTLLPDGRRLLASDTAGYLRIFDMADFTALLALRVGAGWSTAHLTVDAQRMITFDVNDRVRRWELSNVEVQDCLDSSKLGGLRR